MTTSNLKSRAEELSTLFSKTISSISADLTVLQQISSIKTIVLHGNTSNEESLRNSLIDLETQVNSVEEKVHTLQQLVKKEKNSIETLEDLYAKTKDQNKMLIDLYQKKVSESILTPLQQNKNEGDKQNKNTRKNTLEKLLYNTNSKESISEDLRHLHIISPHSISPKTPKHAIVRSYTPVVTPVSTAELLSVPKPIRGRITLATVNNALQEIDQVFRDKHHASQEKLNRHHMLRGRKYRYQQYETALQSETDRMQISEQELRNVCSFFLSGESTARSILVILRTLRRLKQVPNAQEVRYLLNDDDNEED